MDGLAQHPGPLADPDNAKAIARVIEQATKLATDPDWTPARAYACAEDAIKFFSLTESAYQDSMKTLAAALRLRF